MSSLLGKYYYEATVTDEGLCRIGWSTELAALDLGQLVINTSVYTAVPENIEPYRVMGEGVLSTMSKRCMTGKVFIKRTKQKINILLLVLRLERKVS